MSTEKIFYLQNLVPQEFSLGADGLRPSDSVWRSKKKTDFWQLETPEKRRYSYKHQPPTSSEARIDQNKRQNLSIFQSRGFLMPVLLSIRQVSGDLLVFIDSSLGRRWGLMLVRVSALFRRFQLPEIRLFFAPPHQIPRDADKYLPVST